MPALVFSALRSFLSPQGCNRAGRELGRKGGGGGGAALSLMVLRAHDRRKPGYY